MWNGEKSNDNSKTKTYRRKTRWGTEKRDAPAQKGYTVLRKLTILWVLQGMKARPKAKERARARVSVQEVVGGEIKGDTAEETNAHCAGHE